MKKLSIILGSALVMLTAGCSKDATNDVVINDRVTVLNMNIENDADSRTSLGENGYDVLWSAGDCVAVNGVSTTIDEKYAGKSAAAFTVSGVAAPYNVLYPASALNEDGTITVSEVQTYAANSFAQGAAVMVGYSETTQVAVKNLYGLVKLTIQKEGTELIKSITIHSNNLEAMTGVFSVDYANAEITPMSGMDFVKVVASEGIAYDAEGNVVIYVAVPAGTYSNGFTVKVATDAGTMSKTVGKSSGITVKRSKIYTLPAITYSSNEAGAIEITDAATLQAFLTAVNNGDYSAYEAGNGEVQLGADIDMSGVVITPAASFDGVFNGRGYKLKNWASDGTALFTQTVAGSVVKNIVIDESCSMDVSKDAAGYKAFIVANNLGTVSGCSNYANMKFAPTADLTAQYMIGAIVGVSGNKIAGPLVTNCYNEGNLTVTIPSMTGASYYFGGVVGDTSGKSGSISMSYCINKGDVTVTIDGSNGLKNTYIGGVSGACNHGGIINNCVNEGNVDLTIAKVSAEAYINIGGIMSYTACAVNDCKNYGDVHLHATGYKNSTNPTLTRPAIGGIAGYLNGNVTGCENRGHVLLQGINDAQFYKGDDISGITDAAGVGKMTRPVIGGVCGSLGYPTFINPKDNTDTLVFAAKRTISNCHNYGKVELEHPAGKVYMPIGGVVGLPTGTISNCTNHGYIHVISNGRQPYLGGVIGCVIEPENTFENCINYGEVYLEQCNQTTRRSYIGGVFGTYTDTAMDNIAIGCENHGYVHSDATGLTIEGGLFGAHNGTITNCKNHGPVTMNNATYIDNGTIYASEIGGIVGYHNASVGVTIVGCENYGTITNTSASGTDTGGIVAAIGGSKTVKGCIVNCQIISAEGTNAGLVLGSNRTSTSKKITLGATGEPITIKKTTTLNGTAVTAADIKAGGKLVGIVRGTTTTVTITNVVLE
ncbi:MAG: hypothetical protein ACI35T_03005 [Alistipes sp.]